MISQPTNRVSKLSEITKRVHAEGKQANKGKEARIHRFDGRHPMLVTMDIGHSCAMRRQTGAVMIALWLTVIMVTNAVNEDHQHRPGHEKRA